MELLNELVYIIIQLKPINPDQSLPKGSKLQELFNLIAGHVISNDAEAAEHIYGCHPEDKKYLMLKRNLSHKLFEEILMLGNSSEKESSMDMFNLLDRKKLLVAERLLAENFYHNSEKISQKVLKNAQKYDDTELSIRAMTILRKTYTLMGYPKQTAFYQEQILNTYEYLNAKTQLKGALDIFESKLKFSTSLDKELLNELKFYHFEAYNLKSKYKNIQIKLCYLKLKCLRYFVARDAGKLKKALSKLGEFLELHPFLLSEHIRIFYLKLRLHQAMMTNDQEQATMYLGNLMDITSFEAFSKYEVAHIYFNFCLSNQSWHECGIIYDLVVNSRKYQMLNEVDKALWYLNLCFLRMDIMMSDEMIELEIFDKFSFTVKELHEKTAALQKDKSGHLQKVYLLKLLLILNTDDHTWLCNEATSFRMYLQRYMVNSCEQRMVLLYYQLTRLIKYAGDNDKMNQLAKEFNQKLDQINYQKDLNELIDVRKIWNYVNAYAKNMKNDMIVN